ncbi:MAG: RNA 2',3'-cyclic phosphodiesterase [Betaproteobacteria bacterium]|nr:RNA 2',3'-cyclic phosphodiesterase [Betaproteobacteria bacterium]
MARAFFALWPDASVRERLAVHAEEIAKQAGGKPVKPDSLHMTLIFVGNVAEDKLARLAAVVDRISRKPFSMGLDRLSAFAEPGVAWVGTSHVPSALYDIQAQLYMELENAGFDVEQRRFVPHITIARKVTKDVNDRPIDLILWSARTLCLVHSDTKPEGSVYQVVKTWKL